MSEDKGWIKLYRNSFGNQLYFLEPFTKWQAWCDLLLLANHKNGIITKRGIVVKVPRGSIGHGTESLSERWKWSRGKVERFMCFLENDSVKQIVRQKTRITTLISIVNYETYQTNDTTKIKTNDTTDGQQTDTNKNVKEGKEYSNTNTLVKLTPQIFQKNGTENLGGIISNPSGESVFIKRLLEARREAEG